MHTGSESTGLSTHRATLRNTPQVAREARHEVVQVLGDRCGASVIEIAALLTSELATNALLHGSPPMQLRIALSERLLRVEVHDASRVAPAPRTAGSSDANGRGLAIIEAMASRWGTDVTDGGKSVWFELADL
ncbi:MAG: ATP-binding protein [Acidimicrobiia bacterium]